MDSSSFYSYHGCRFPLMTQYSKQPVFDIAPQESNSSDYNTTGSLIGYRYVPVGSYCSIASAELIPATYRDAQVALIIITLPAVVLSLVVVYKKFKFEYESARNDWKAMMRRVTVFLLINAFLFTFTHLLWAINPNWADVTYGTVPCALIRIVPPVTAFNMICAYIYRFQSTLNELISRSSHALKTFSIASSALFFLSTVTLVSFEIATKDSTVPMVIWSTFFLIYSIINLAFGIQVVRALHKTESELKKMSRFTMARTLVLKALSITVGLSVAGLVFFSPYMLDSWSKLLNPLKRLPQYLSVDDVQGNFVFSVIMYQCVTSLAEYSFYWTNFSCKRAMGNELGSGSPNVLSNVVSTSK